MTTDEGYSFGPYLLDVPRRALLRDGEALALTSKAFDTLLALVRNRDRVVSKDELLQLVWPDAFVSEDSLTQSVSVLRRTLGDRSGQPQFIATVPRRGYRFVGVVEPLAHSAKPVENGAPAGEAADASEASSEDSGPLVRRSSTVARQPF